jgi:hypothetical protein
VGDLAQARELGHRRLRETPLAGGPAILLSEVREAPPGRRRQGRHRIARRHVPVDLPRDLQSGRGPRLAGDERLAEGVHRAQFRGQLPLLRVIDQRQREQHRHRAAEAVAGDVQGLEGGIDALPGSEQGLAFESEPELPENAPARRPHVPAKPRVNGERFATERHALGADVGVTEPVPRRGGLGAPVAENCDAPAAALQHVGRGEHQHRVHRLRDADATAALEPQAARHGGHRVGVGVGVGGEGAEHVRNQRVSLDRGHGRVRREQPCREVHVDWEGCASSLSHAPFHFHDATSKEGRR